jgi:hypothetical protein
MPLHRVLPGCMLMLVLSAPAAQSAGPDQIYVGVTTIEAFNPNEAPQQKWEYLVIYPQGLAMREIPSGGVDYDNVARLAEKHDSKVGSYTRTEDGMQITWGRGSRRNQVWDLEASGTGWIRGRDTTFRRADRVNKDAIKGIWKQKSVLPTNMMDVSGGEFIFRTNGEFEQGSKHGRYELDGYALTLHDSKGETRRYAIYRWPWGGSAIAIDTRVYQLLQTRQ